MKREHGFDIIHGFLMCYVS